jgi:TolB-like protein
MSENELTRRLAAIVVADVVGYSRLMEADESGTFDRMRTIRSELVDPKTSQFRGRVVKGTGDGWLAEFPSVTDAVASSLDIQQAVALRNAQLSAGERLEFRIGINLGEIIIDGDDIYGTGVNIAARLEAIAAPGGICISDSIYQQVHGILDLRVEDLGAQTVKNITEPIRAYAVRRGEPIRTEAASGDGERPRTTESGASIAVLPFNNFSPDPDQDYFVDGMVEDIITALSRFRWLTVTARASTFAYKGKAVDVRQFASDLGVRYVLEGSVQKAGSRVRITGQLIDATAGSHMWADRFEGDLADVFELQNQITEQVVSAIEPQIRRAEIERARRKRPELLDAHDLFLRALPHAYAVRPEDCDVALELLEEAMRLDPGYVPAAAFAAWCHEQRIIRNWPGVSDRDSVEALRLARITLAADTDDALMISIAGFVLVMVGHDHDAGLAALARAVELNAHNPLVLAFHGWANVLAGDLDVARASLERARHLSRRDPIAFAFQILTGLAMNHLLAGRCEEAAELAAAGGDGTRMSGSNRRSHCGHGKPRQGPARGNGFPVWEDPSNPRSRAARPFSSIPASRRPPRVRPLSHPSPITNQRARTHIPSSVRDRH